MFFCGLTYSFPLQISASVVIYERPLTHKHSDLHFYTAKAHIVNPWKATAFQGRTFLAFFWCMAFLHEFLKIYNFL